MEKGNMEITRGMFIEGGCDSEKLAWYDGVKETDYISLLSLFARDKKPYWAAWALDKFGSVDIETCIDGNLTGDYFFHPGSVSVTGDILVNVEMMVGVDIRTSRKIRVNGDVWAGRDIRAGGNVRVVGKVHAGRDIRTKGDVRTEGSIRAGRGIRAERGIRAGEDIWTEREIWTGEGIYAVGNVLVGGDIRAKKGIHAGEIVRVNGNIESGGGIHAFRVMSGLKPENIVKGEWNQL